MDSEVLRGVIERVLRVVEPDRIVLFGSAARGAIGPGSDIDLLVIKRGLVHRGRIASRMYVSFIGLGVPVDVVLATPEEVEYARTRVGSVLRPAIEAGRDVYVRPDPGDA
ncbi:MAG: nucleotidyltransferase domain-containing protein [Deltaproteobacteria bacterium]|nr:nucleotidyltransferase domain-containing protein [Deltaproteobacteria bacterium]